MQRTTIVLPPELKFRAAERARELGVSLGEWIRQCLDSGLARVPAGKRKDSLFADGAALAQDRARNLAEKHDEYLYGDEDDLH